MRTTVIPAQITTIEDKIAGNFNLTQISLLLASLFIATLIYAVFPQRMAFSLYKIPFIMIEFLICVTLSLRIKGRVVLNWIFILSSYYLRPTYYIYSKNDVFMRHLDLMPAPENKKVVSTAKAFAKKNKLQQVLSVSDISYLKKLLAHRTNLSFKFDKNGGMNAIWQVKN